MWAAVAATALLLPLAAAGASVRFPVVQDDIRFNSAVDSIKSSQVADLLSALSGYTLADTSTAWNGLRSYNPMRHPTLFLIAEFELGPSMCDELTMNSNLHYKLENDALLDAEFASFKSASVRRWPEAEGRMQAVDTGVDTDPVDLQSERLREAVSLHNDERFEPSLTSDRAFLLEYYTMKDVVSEAAKAPVDSSPSTVYWLKMSSLRTLADEYGVSHKKTQRAAQLFSQLVGSATGQLETHPRSLFVVIQEDERLADTNATTVPLSRSRRDVEDEKVAEAAAAPNPDELNLAYPFDKEYHVVFAIVTFTMLVITLGVLATSTGLWFMDPGRDSIIYRMTSQRMKMD